ncbi:MAG: LacI family transcriptional regulator [Verrucomicrobia bacterium]|nr:MAG: LacI family transcriptional regulator [Verrucomicrobiota bacterium]
MNSNRVTLADIARRAGVHPTTVSLALRNNPRIPEATRNRLKQLAQEMRYVPDPGAKALASYRRDANAPRVVTPVAYVTNWNTRYGWREVTAHGDFYEGARKRAEEIGMVVEHFWMREPGLTHGRLSQILDSRGIRGVVVASHVREIDEELKLDWSRFSAVKIDYFPHRPELPIVTNDQLHIIRLAMRKVLSAGYTRIGFVMDQGYDITVDHLWSAGFVWEQQSIAPSERIPPYMFPRRESLAEWIRRYRPEAIIGKAEWVFPTLEEMGIEVPRDMAYVDIFNEDETGKIAGVRQNHEVVGATAINILSGLLQHNTVGIPEIPTTTLIEGTWIDGESLPKKTVWG